METGQRKPRRAAERIHRETLLNVTVIKLTCSSALPFKSIISELSKVIYDSSLTVIHVAL